MVNMEKMSTKIIVNLNGLEKSLSMSIFLSMPVNLEGQKFPEFTDEIIEFDGGELR
jgi:hypothetical protein